VREFGNGLAVVPTRPEHADALAALQITVFPTLAADQRFTAAHYRKHVELFPEGQWCAIERETGRVVGATSTIRYDWDFANVSHTFAEIIEGGWLTSHDPTGRWMYGADISAHPEYRGRGIARALYAMRQDVVRRLGLEGQITVGMPSGYGACKGDLTAEAYYAEILAGTRSDPTISAQLKIGFEPRGLLANYLDDPVCDNYGVLLVLPASRDVPFPA
jgi:GNAT superfamily N-acetyltransferase